MTPRPFCSAASSWALARRLFVVTLVAAATWHSLPWLAAQEKPAEAAAEAAKAPADSPAAGEKPVEPKSPGSAAAIDPMDWPNWRGPQQNSTSTEKNLVDKWNPKQGEKGNLLWKRSDLGTRSTPIVMRGKLYVLVRDKPGTADEGEKVVCVDAATGEQKWERRLDVYLSDVPDTRVGWSNVVGDPETGLIYAQGVGGLFACIDGDSGKIVLSHNLVEEFGTITTYGGRTNNPVMFDDLVLISAILVGWGDTPEFDGLARPAHRFMAFDKLTGELRWLNGTTLSPPDTNYSTPVVKVVGGEAQLIFGGADGKLWVLQPRTGVHLWNYPLSQRSINSSPIVVGTTVYGGHSEENLVGSTQGAVVALDATQRGDLAGKEKWIQYTLMAGKSSPVMVGDRLWVVTDGAKLQILNPETGKQVGRKALSTVMRSTPVFADGKVYLCTNNGIWYILKPKGDEVEVVQKLRLSASDQNDGSPIVSHGRIYLPTSEAFYCIGNKEAKPEADPLPPAEQEPPVSQDEQPATVLLSPYDATVPPDGTQKFTARLYNARGQFLRIAAPEEVKFAVQGPGEVAPDGTYTASKRDSHAGALVTCTVGPLNAKARVRLVPPLPWRFDFEKTPDMPITWIGGRVRYVIEDLEGNKVAKKLDVLPTPANPNNKLGTRSQLFMGPGEMANYTIEADFRLTEKNGRMPDVGVNNSGYTLSLRAGDKRLRVYSWLAHDHRTAAEVEFDPQPGVWYRLKLEVKQVDGKAQVRGKIWPQDQDEPKDWTVEMKDNSPITSGSPGIFGHSQEAEFYMDNISVTANE
jgi:outer membrane protein assembly factor BamB